MKNKIIVLTILSVLFISVLNFVYATENFKDDLKDTANSMKNTTESAGSMIKDSAEDMGEQVKDSADKTS